MKDFRAARTVGYAVQSDAMVTGIVGPVGSGKSVGGSTWCARVASSQLPWLDGVRRSRIAIIRNTTPELKTTTLNTFTDTWPEGDHGRVIMSAPISYHWRTPHVDAEFLFVALDRPGDVKKLLSFELTGAWVNEARETVKPIIDALTERIGRYPPAREVPAQLANIWMDTNAMDSDHWWCKAFDDAEPQVVLDPLTGEEIEITWRGYNQPPAVLEVEPIGSSSYRVIEPGFEQVSYPENMVIHAGGSHWVVNPLAENLPNLRPGYYARQLANKTREHIQCYQQGKRVFVADGAPVVPEYSAEVHGRTFDLDPKLPLVVGIDCGGGTLQPAAVFGQTGPRGIRFVHSELVASSMGIERFADELERHLLTHYRGFRIEHVWLDPASEKRDEIYETRVIQYLRRKGLPCRPAPTQDVATRISAIQQPAMRLIDGKPGLWVHPTLAPMVHAGLSGKWHYRKVQVVGEDRYADKPSKNQYSHPCEAAGYMLCGMGEVRLVPAGMVGAQGGTSQADTGWSVYG